MKVKFSGEIFYWRGPAPFYFISTPEKISKDIKAISNRLTYGWGCIQVTARIGTTEWKTALIPKDGSYFVPMKKVIREQFKLDEGSTTSIALEFEERC